jgi:hypothetical protein
VGYYAAQLKRVDSDAVPLGELNEVAGCRGCSLRTGSDSMPRTELEQTRFGWPTTLDVSSQTVRSYYSASRLPTQR